MNKIAKNTANSVLFGIAFVWFTTQFGGGFATGNQLRQYFVDFGVASLVTIILSQLVMAIPFWYCLRYARTHELYNYRAYNNSFYGKTAPLFANAFEVVYFLSVVMGTAAAFATTASSLETTFGLNYWVGIILAGVCIFSIAVYGTNVVRKTAAIISILIVAGLIMIYIPNIIAQWDAISTNMATSVSNGLNWSNAIWSGFVYGIFQAGSIGVMCVQAQALEKPQDAWKSIAIGMVINCVIAIMAVLGLMAVMYDDGFGTAAIPLLNLVQKGPMAGLFGTVITLLMVLGSVSTGVNLVSGISARICSALDKNFDATAKPGRISIITTLIITVLCFCVAQFGLTAIVGRGYRYVGTVGIFVIFLPYLVHMVVTKLDIKGITAMNGGNDHE